MISTNRGLILPRLRDITGFLLFQAKCGDVCQFADLGPVRRVIYFRGNPNNQDRTIIVIIVINLFSAINVNKNNELFVITKQVTTAEGCQKSVMAH